MRGFLVLAALVVMASFGGLFVNEADAIGADIIFQGSKVTTPLDCRINDNWGERWGKQMELVYANSRVGNVWGCKIPCGGDLNCWNRGSIFLGFDTTVAGYYGINLHGVRKANAMWAIDGYLAHQEMWAGGNSEVHVALLPAYSNIQVFGRQCYDANEDDAVSGLDFFEVMTYLGTGKGDWLFCPECDFNDDDAVSGLDFFAVIGQFGLDCTHAYRP